uniref:Uncharacterized protein n=1 Tax=Vespula pensylvanica TaxID=30213 RepID=A0A834PBJ0_VESPE|nr:hypothetical protein H0235_003134 [Vespula pensylvanica]
MNIFLSRFCNAENSYNRNRNRFIFSREKEHGDPELSKTIPAIDSLLSFSLPPTKHWTRLDEEEQIKKKELVNAMGGALATIRKADRNRLRIKELKWSKRAVPVWRAAMKMVLRTIVVSLYGSRNESGGNIAEYGGIPDQIYRARAGLPLRTVHIV